MIKTLAGMVRRDDFCEQIGITSRTAREWRSRNYGPPPRLIGGKVYYVQQEIDEFLIGIRDGHTRSGVA